VQELARASRLALGGLERLRVRFHRSAVVAEIPEHVAELGEESARSRSIAVLELQLEQLLDHVELAELPVDLASFGQRIDERRIELESVLEVLERLHPLEEALVKEAAEPEVIISLPGRILCAGDALLEGFLEPVPVVVQFQLLEALL
jgi:hypothetical protein